MTRTSGLDFDSGTDPDPAYRWDTKLKRFSLAEVCAPPSAVLVLFLIFLAYNLLNEAEQMCIHICKLSVHKCLVM